MKKVSRLALCLCAFVSSVSMAETRVSEDSPCVLLDKAGLVEQAFPLCLSGKASNHDARVLFRWMFDRKFETLSLSGAEQFLAHFRLRLGDADYSYLSGLIYAAYGRHEQAEEYYKKASDLGDAEAAYELYMSLSKKSEAREPLKYLERSANGGYDIAQYSLGVRLLEGEGFDKDVKKALALIERAALQGNGSAIAKLHDLSQSLGEQDRTFWQLVYGLTLESIDGKSMMRLIENADKHALCRKLKEGQTLFFDLRSNQSLSHEKFEVVSKMILSCMDDGGERNPEVLK